MGTLFRHQTLILVCAVVLAGPAEATTLRQLSLKELATSADKVFRGRVVGIDATVVKAGGGELPVTVYRIKVAEQFKGLFDTVKGDAVVEIRTIAVVKSHRVVAGLQRISPFRDVPQLSMGQEYVLFTTRPSRIGLSTTVGLGQGAFRVDANTKDESTVNAFGNQGLNTGLATPFLPPSGPVAYTQFATAIRSVLTEVTR